VRLQLDCHPRKTNALTGTEIDPRSNTPSFKALPLWFE
jgi:hypothetical protein